MLQSMESQVAKYDSAAEQQQQLNMHKESPSQLEGSRPWQRPRGREPDKTQRRGQASGVPPGIS